MIIGQKRQKIYLMLQKKAVEERHMYRGFSYLDSARSFLFLGIKNEDDLRAAAQAILNEAEDPDKRWLLAIPMKNKETKS
jgi:hypothetical protein